VCQFIDWQKEEEIHMKKIVMLAALAGSASVAMADDLILVDLSVVNQVTITSTTGLSAGTRSAGTGDGIYLQNFFTSAVLGMNVAGTGAFRSVNGTVGDGTPSLFRGGGVGEMGLNVWSFATTATFTTGQQAFSGTGTWTVSAAQYASLLGGNASGNLYFPADTQDDIAAGATLLGTWRLVPTPGAAAVLGLGGLALGRRRRA
jgi:hypothetical protein